ncbi:hypothetical protein AXF19_06335 [Selenomonas sp. oral taxon 126]|nr:hypothetical protein AXF19_06335 [Selenomonas sp. oral taxon 126]
MLRTIRQRCATHQLRWTNHILTRLFQRGISIDDVMHTMTNGEIIERYPEDYPYPSYLIFGVTVKNAWLHVVCGISIDRLHLITAYNPDPERWESDGKTRKEKTQ